MHAGIIPHAQHWGVNLLTITKTGGECSPKGVVAPFWVLSQEPAKGVVKVLQCSVITDRCFQKFHFAVADAKRVLTHDLL